MQARVVNQPVAFPENISRLSRSQTVKKMPDNFHRHICMVCLLQGALLGVL